MKQLGMGFLQYTQDYDERWPMGSQPYGTIYYLGIGWGGMVYPYVKSAQVYKCPSDPSVPTAPTRVTVSYGVNVNLTEFDTTAAVNPIDGGVRMNSLMQMAAPAQSVLLYEMQGSEANVSDPNESGGAPYSCSSDGLNNLFCLAGTTTNNNGTNNNGTALYSTGYLGGRTYATGACTWAPSAMTTGCYGQSTGRHLDGANFCMADGHAKWYPGSRVSNGGSAINPTDPQNPSVANGTSAAGTQDTSGRFAVTFSTK